MSPRAACRLETLGFEEVYDYVEGKADWVARGLPTEGDREDERRIGQLARRDVVTCALDERVGDVRSRVEASPYGFALVVAGDDIVLGRLRRAALEETPMCGPRRRWSPDPPRSASICRRPNSLSASTAATCGRRW